MRNPGEFKDRQAKRSMAPKLRQKDVKQILRRLWAYLYAEKHLLILSLVLVLIANLLALFGPALLGKAIAAIGTQQGQVDFRRVFSYVGVLVIFYLASALLSYIQSVMMIRLSQHVVGKMRRDVFAKLSSLPAGFYDRRQTGDIISVISYDINTVNESISHDFIQICASTVTIVGSFLMMLFIKPALVLVFVVTIPLSVIFTRQMSRIVRPLYSRRSEKLGAMNGYVEEMVGGHKTIRAYNREARVNEGFAEKNQAATVAYKKAGYLGIVPGPVVNFVNNLSLTLVGVFGSLMYLSGGLRLDGLSSFVLYSRKFSGPINDIANIYADLQSALAAADRVFRLLDEAPEKPDAPDAQALVEVRGDVRFDHVRFGYDATKIILHDLTLHAPPGSLIAIVGPTGAGKTTIINLLMRFYDADAGGITVDDNDIYALRRDSLRRAYVMVLQDTWLFHGTIFDNIAYSKPDATMEEVVAAARAAKIHSFITKLPQGYDTILSDDGVNISKGQKQLLTIARAMLMDANMLILDEATSNVDTQTERQIQSAMKHLMQNKTSFVIAHRLSTIEEADLILVLRDGNVVEQGTHQSLMAQGGFYAEMYRSQFVENESRQEA
ncbi:MAG: ABC transporter ATP-binding protein [Eubacteriales bacterium]